MNSRGVADRHSLQRRNSDGRSNIADQGEHRRTLVAKAALQRSECDCGQRHEHEASAQPLYEPGFDDQHFVHTKRKARSEEHTSELQSLMRISYAVLCLKKKKTTQLN